jgi:hypothetical protein
LLQENKVTHIFLIDGRLSKDFYIFIRIMATNQMCPKSSNWLKPLEAKIRHIFRRIEHSEPSLSSCLSEIFLALQYCQCLNIYTLTFLPPAAHLFVSSRCPPHLLSSILSYFSRERHHHVLLHFYLLLPTYLYPPDVLRHLLSSILSYFSVRCLSMYSYIFTSCCPPICILQISSHTSFLLF